MLETSGSHEQFDNLMEKHLNFYKTLNAFGTVLKVKIRFLQFFGWQSDEAPPAIQLFS